MALPRIISVDDHVVEPAHVWQTWLPAKWRARGPRVERKKWGSFKHLSGAKYDMVEDPEGEWGDAWIYDDELIYVQKKFVAIPEAAVSKDANGDLVLDRPQMTMTATTYDEMRKGCWDRDERVKDLALNYTDGSLPFPTFPRFCGQTFYENKDTELGLACVRANNDWMVEEWCGPEAGGRLIPLTLIPLWDAELAAAEVRRNAERGVRAVCFSEIPPFLGLPSVHDPDRYWDPFFRACAETGTIVNMHIGSSSKMPSTSADAPPAVGSTLTHSNATYSMVDFMFSGVLVRFPDLKLAYAEGQIGWIPYILERADNVWEENRGWGGVADIVPEPPSTYFHRQIYGCFFDDAFGLKNVDSVGVDNITYESDYPHSDSTWPHTKEIAERQMAHLDDETKYKIVRGNAIKLFGLDHLAS
jgi:predicted TIM-barrel fold metal-dependent hydrolase